MSLVIAIKDNETNKVTVGSDSITMKGMYNFINTKTNGSKIYNKSFGKEKLIIGAAGRATFASFVKNVFRMPERVSSDVNDETYIYKIYRSIKKQAEEATIEEPFKNSSVLVVYNNNFYCFSSDGVADTLTPLSEKYSYYLIGSPWDAATATMYAIHKFKPEFGPRQIIEETIKLLSEYRYDVCEPVNILEYE